MKPDTSANIQQFYFNTTNDCDLNQTSIIQKDLIQHADCDYNVAVNVSNVLLNVIDMNHTMFTHL